MAYLDPHLPLYGDLGMRQLGWHTHIAIKGYTHKRGRYLYRLRHECLYRLNGMIGRMLIVTL